MYIVTHDVHSRTTCVNAPMGIRFPGLRRNAITREIAGGGTLSDTAKNESVTNNHALVQAVRMGDEAAFQQIVEAYYANLCSFANTYMKGDDLAEEVVQDVFLSVWERREQWVVSTSIKSYLYGAVRNKALNVLRRVRAEDRITSRVTTDEWPLGVGLGKGSELDRMVTAEVWGAIRSVIEEMPEKRRVVFLLRWDHGMSYAEIAAATGASVTAVERQLVRALQTLRAALNQVAQG